MPATPAATSAAGASAASLYADALAWASAQKITLAADFYSAASAAARNTSWSVAGLTQLDTLQAIHTNLTDALAQGQTLAQWKAAILTGPASPLLQLAPHRLDNIFRTNIQTAYMRGIARQQESPSAIKRRPFFQYDSINDSRTRPAHAAMDNFIAPHDDPIWRSWTPPAGYRCRCVRIALSPAEAAARGWDGSTQPVPAQPDKGFDHHPLDGAETIERVLRERVQKAHPAIQKAFNAASAASAAKATDSVASIKQIAEYLSGAGMAPIGVAALPPDLRHALKAATSEVLLSRPTADKQAKHPEISAQSFAQLQELIDRGERIYDKARHVIIIYQVERPYLAVLKVTQSGEQVFLQSFRRTDENNIHSLKKRVANSE